MVTAVEFFEAPALDAGVAGDFGSDTCRPDDLEFRVRFGGHCEVDTREEGGQVCLVRRSVSERIDVHLRGASASVVRWEERWSRLKAVFRIEARRG